MTPTEVKFVIWVLLALLGIIAWIGKIGVSALIKMSNDIGEIKTTVMVQSAKHDDLERRVNVLETWK